MPGTSEPRPAPRSRRDEERDEQMEASKGKNEGGVHDPRDADGRRTREGEREA